MSERRKFNGSAETEKNSIDKQMEKHVMENPTDLDNLLVYADFLTERGDERGELIVLEHALQTNTSMDYEKQTAARKRIAEINTPENQNKWLEHLGVPEGVKIDWKHGFISGLRLIGVKDGAGKGFIEKLAADIEGTIWEKLSVRGISKEDIKALVASEALKKVKKLDIANCDVDDEVITELVRAGNLKQLTSFDAENGSITNEGVNAITLIAEQLAMEILTLNGNQISDEGAIKIAEARNLSALKELNLRENQLGFDGAASILESETLSSLKKVNVENNQMSPEEQNELHRYKKAGVRLNA